MSAAIGEFLSRPVWEGGRTLEVGEVIGFLAGIALIFWLGKADIKNLWVWVGLLVILLCMILF